MPSPRITARVLSSSGDLDDCGAVVPNCSWPRTWLLVPAGSEEQAIVTHDPGVFLTVFAGFRVYEDVVDPFARLGSAAQVVAVEVAGGVNAEAGIAPDEHGVVVGYGVAVLVDDEDVPLTIDAFLRAVVLDCGVQAEGIVEV